MIWARNHEPWLFFAACSALAVLAVWSQFRYLENQARITGQIKADGSQPEEIRRVDGLGYSVYNLEAQARVARLAAGLGIDLWNHTAPDGAGLRRAIEFLKPFNSSPEKWPFSQKAKLRPGFLDKLIAEAAAHPAAQGIPR